MKIGGDEDLMRKWEELLESIDQVRIKSKFQIQLKIGS